MRPKKQWWPIKAAKSGIRPVKTFITAEDQIHRIYFQESNVGLPRLKQVDGVPLCKMILYNTDRYLNLSK